MYDIDFNVVNIEIKLQQYQHRWLVAHVSYRLS